MVVVYKNVVGLDGLAKSLNFATLLRHNTTKSLPTPAIGDGSLCGVVR